eukprot:m.22761 g.22761  ORF g.22761 m.22761 type:complete len:512 (-) comp7434_c0_seq1:72-1607(-)
MAGGGADDGGSYSLVTGSVYVFNLIVGAGALALPDAFSQAGYIGGTVLLFILAMASAITSSFMIEAMSLSNALAKSRGMVQDDDTNSDKAPLLKGNINETADDDKDALFRITHRPLSEMAFLAGAFFTPLGEKVFYAVIAIYLYGDLCIYAVAVPKSLRSVFCPLSDGNATEYLDTFGNGYSTHSNHSEICFLGLTHEKSYYAFLVIFALALGPFCYFSMTKTKWLQIFTTVMRYVTFLMLISLAVVGIIHPDPFVKPTNEDHPPKFKDITVFNLHGMTIMFGVSVYAFMCQHSLPSLLTPISNQRNLPRMVFIVFILVAFFYYALIYSAILRFPAKTLTDPNYDVYTLVFADYPVRFCSVFLQLFPVFVLSTNFPIISITLRNNLITLGRKIRGIPPGQVLQSKTAMLIERLLVPTLAIGPPILVAFFTTEVEVLISFTGSYAGVGIQYVIPTMAVYSARRVARGELGNDSTKANPFKSVFYHDVWIFISLFWSAACVIIVTYNHITQAK